MSIWMTKYVELEREMLSLDARGLEADADDLRDLMDVVWRKLSDGERRALNERPFVVELSRPRLSLESRIDFDELRVRIHPLKSPARELAVSIDDLRVAG